MHFPNRNTWKVQVFQKIKQRLFFLFVSVQSTSFLTLVRSYLMSFSFFSAWHNVSYLTLTFVFTLSMKVLAGLKAGT